MFKEDISKNASLQNFLIIFPISANKPLKKFTFWGEKDFQNEGGFFEKIYTPESLTPTGTTR